MRKQQEIIKSFEIKSERKGEKMKTQTTLTFESGLQYTKTYYGYDEKMENVCIGDQFTAFVDDGKVIAID